MDFLDSTACSTTPFRFFDLSCFDLQRNLALRLGFRQNPIASLRLLNRNIARRDLSPRFCIPARSRGERKYPATPPLRAANSHSPDAVWMLRIPKSTAMRTSPIISTPSVIRLLRQSIVHGEVKINPPPTEIAK